MPDTRSASGSDASFWETLKNDWEHVNQQVKSGWRQNFRKTHAELEEFYLTPEHRQRLARARGLDAGSVRLYC
jgi:hypothetical protein